MSTRVAWATLQPTETEQILSVLLCRRNPSARRVRPSKGDGGIDVITETPAGWVVDQIKYFTASLTLKQKAQVAKSYERLRRYADGVGARIAEWHLVLPLDHTNEERVWFDELTGDAGYSCEWRGHAYVEGLAAEFPDVIDYYLSDGRQRLEALVGRLTDVIRLGQGIGDASGKPLTPAEATVGLTGLYEALNIHDPHYRYSFSVDAQRPSVHDEPFLVAVAQQSTDSTCVTFRIHARFADADVERPVPMSVRIRLPQDPAELAAIRGFHDFGAPLTVEDPEGNKIEWDIDLPGGLGGRFQGGRLSFGPARTDDARPYRLRMQVTGPDGREISTSMLDMEPVTRGVSGKGIRAVGVEQHGVFTMEMRTDFDAQRITITVTAGDLTGKHPNDVLPGLRLAAAFLPPNRMRFAAPYGPITGPTDVIPGAIGLGFGDELLVVEALAVVQEHTVEQVFIPDFTTVSRRDGGELVRLAQLLRDGTVRVIWDKFDVALEISDDSTEASVTEGGHDVARSFLLPCLARVGDADLALGTVRYDLISTRVESITPAEGGIRVRFLPSGDRTAILTFEPPQADPAE